MAKNRKQWPSIRKRYENHGRKCKWCSIYDSETAVWSSNEDECSTCQRSRYRRSCKKCGGPAYGNRQEKAYCPRCGPFTKNMVKIILVAPDERERVIWRKVRISSPGVPRWKKRFKLEGAGPFIVFDEEIWMTVRR